MNKNRVFFVLTGVSLLLSFASLYIAINARTMVQKEIESMSSPVWVVNIDHEKNTIQFKNQGPGGMVLDTAKIAFASNVGLVETEVKAPRYEASLREFVKAVKDTIDGNPRTRSFDEGKAAKWIESEVPVLVVSNYAYRGKNYNDVSIYMLQYSALIPKEKAEFPLGFRGLRFAERLTGKSVEKYSKVANELLSNLRKGSDEYKKLNP